MREAHGAKKLRKSKQKTGSNETSLYKFKNHFGKMLSSDIYFIITFGALEIGLERIRSTLKIEISLHKKSTKS